MVIKFTVKRAKPRNPIVATARHCGAGAHRTGNTRQRDRRWMQHELAQMEKPPHPR